MESKSRATFGSCIASHRKARYLTQAELIQRATLTNLINARQLNEFEQDRADPRLHPLWNRVVSALSTVLNIPVAELSSLADDFERAVEIRGQFEAILIREAIAYRARTQRG